MKHIKIRGDVVRNTVVVTLLEQSHTLAEFGTTEGADGMPNGHTFNRRNVILYNVSVGGGLMICYDYRRGTTSKGSYTR